MGNGNSISAMMKVLSYYIPLYQSKDVQVSGASPQRALDPGFPPLESLLSQVSATSGPALPSPM